MAKINQLDSSIYTKIAAGEVVDEPAGVVKELVENSIDAGATKIVVEIVEGGTKKIRVSDNGCGIEASQIKKAFLPHATSKIASITDLYSISTLGFRGEALSSIASVSKLSVLSKIEQSEVGAYLEIEGGVVTGEGERGATTGTTIIVSNLFYNVPARLKFLRKLSSEEHSISKVMTKFILGNPKLEFIYIVDGEIKYQTSSGFLIDAIREVYNDELVANLVKVYSENGDITVNGYVTGPNYSKNNSTYQNLYVNGRGVECPELILAVRNAYYDVLMRGKFPAFVLYINLPYDKVDTNVHPKKSIVKFSNSNELFSIVYKAVRRVITSVQGIVKLQKETGNVVLDSEPLPTFDYSSGASFVKTSEAVDPKQTEQSNELLNKFKTISTLGNVRNINIAFKEIESETVVAQKSFIYEKLDELNNTNKKQEVEQSTFLQQDFSVVGVLFNTYIIVEQGDEVFFIDQHAAHERMLFDKFMKELEYKTITKQQLLIPYVLTVNDEENDFIASCLIDFKEMGFEIELFGSDSYKVNFVPTLLSNVSLRVFFDDVLSELNIFKTKNEKIKDTLATKACKAAVKGGDNLSKQEIATLLNMVKESTTPLHCPHGRPYVVNFTKDNLEKWFKRQV